MKTIESLDAAWKVTFEELGVHRAIYWAYRNSREADTETLDFEDVIWEQDIPGIVRHSALKSTGSPFPAGCPAWPKPSGPSRKTAAA